MCAVGIDVGTAWLCTARRNSEGQISLHSDRNAFIDIDPGMESMIESYSYIKDTENGSDRLIVLGRDAVTLANLYSKTTKDGRTSLLRRPMKYMIINSKSEKKAVMILRHMLHNLVGKAEKEGEVAAVSIPANPINSDQNNVFHTNMCCQFIKELGYEVIPVNEALSIVFASN